MQSMLFICRIQFSRVMFFGMSVRAAEILGRRNFHHRVPVDRRIVVRRGGRARRRHRREIELLAGLGAHLRQVDEAIAAHPDLIVRGRKIGNDVAALVVGDDAPGEAGRQVGGLGDHPDAGFRPLRLRAPRRRCRRRRSRPRRRAAECGFGCALTGAGTLAASAAMPIAATVENRT